MILGRKSIDFETLFTAISKKEKITADLKLLKNLQKNRKNLEELISFGSVMYGINTGFGALRNKNISPKDLAKLQENLILSHAVGVGRPIQTEIVKTIMIIIANYLIKGYSGVRPVVVSTLLEMVNKNVIPVVPEKGSVGSSGDLAPSAHIILVMMGKGEAYFNGKKMPGMDALKLAKIKPLVLDAKEGLATINNTATMTAHAVFSLNLATILKDTADIAGALSAEALRATPKAFDPRIHNLKPHPGQKKAADNMRRLLLGSTMLERKRVQDQYSIRCIPQVHGAVRDAIDYSSSVVNRELNSVTDNPLIFFLRDQVDVVSGGNFHGESVAIAMDTLKLACAEFANISDRRISSLLDPSHNFGLPAFLAKEPGLNSGMMILQYTTAALVSENKILAHPAVVDSVPTSANTEDHVSMGTIAARKSLEVLENVLDVLSIEIFVACQAIDFRFKEGYRLGLATNKIFKTIRKEVPFLERDTQYMPHIEKIKTMITANKLSL